MPFSGAIRHEDLRRARATGFTPKIKIWLQEIVQSGRTSRTGSRMLKLDHWTQASWSRELGSMGRASITLSNIGDQFFRRKYRRNFVPEEAENQMAEYFKDVISRTYPYMKEINPDRRGSEPIAQLSDRPSATDNQVLEYLYFLYNDGSNLGSSVDNQRSHDLLELGVMQRVIIDVLGQDGLWYAGFTGIVSAVEETFTAGDVPMVTLQCRDYWRLLGLSEIYMRAGAAAGMVINSIEQRLQEELGILNKAQGSTNSLADLSGIDIMHQTLDIINRSLCFTPFIQGKEGLIAYQYDDAARKAYKNKPSLEVQGEQTNDQTAIRSHVQIDRTDFFTDEGFWYLPFFDKKKVEPDYVGLTNLRRIAPQIHVFGKDGILGPASDLKVETSLKQDNGKPWVPGAELPDAFPTAWIYSTLHVDANIARDSAQAIAYQLLIEKVLGLFQTQKAAGDQIIKKVADASFYDVFFNANGDLVYQIPRYNNLPGEYLTDFDFTVTRQVSETSLQKKGAVFGPPETAADAINKSVAASNTFMSSVAGEQAAADARLSESMVTGLGDAAISDPFVGISPGVPLTDAQLAAARVAKEAAAAPVSVTTTKLATMLSTVRGKYGDFTKSGFYDFAPPVQNFASKYHGFNYILTDLGLRRWRFGMHEELVTTELVVPAGGQLLNMNEQIQSNAFTGRTQLLDTKSLQGRFGHRAVQAQQIFLPNIYADVDKEENEGILNAFALALMQQLNGKSKNGNVELSSRPDLEIGNTLFVLERQRLYYITGYSYTFRFGEDATTSLTMAFGHDIGDQITSPFASIAEDLIKLKARKPPTATQVNEANASTSSTEAESLPFVGGILPGLSDVNTAWSAASSRQVTHATTTTDLSSNLKYILEEPEDLFNKALIVVRGLNQDLAAAIQDNIDVYSLARGIASEAGAKQTVFEKIVVAYILKRLKGSFRTVTGRLTFHKSNRHPLSNHYGEQGGRAASTAKDPSMKDIVIANAVMTRAVADPFPGGTNYFSPGSQKSLHQREPGRFKSPSGLTEFWYTKRSLVWLGELPGITVKDFMVFAKKGHPQGKSLPEALATAKKYDV